MSVSSLPLNMPNRMVFTKCSTLTLDKKSGDLLVLGYKRSLINDLAVGISILFYALYCFFLTDSQRAHTYTQLSLCKGLNISHPDVPTRIIGLPKKLPKFLFVSAHHNFRIQMHHIINPAFLTNYENVYTVTKIDFKILGSINITKQINFLINSIDLINKSVQEQFYDVVSPMQTHMNQNQSCVVIIYTTRCDSAFLGDTSMCMRKGIFAASLALQVPIMDVINVEPTPSVQETTVDISIYDPPAMNACTQASKEDYENWRHIHEKEINHFNDNVQQSYLQRVSAVEDSKASCGIHDELKTCSGKDNYKAFLAFTENERSCKRSK